MSKPHPRTGRVMGPGTSSRYRFNPDCGCEICSNNGQIPANHAEIGHGFCYGLEHIPPVSRPPWRTR